MCGKNAASGTDGVRTSTYCLLAPKELDDSRLLEDTGGFRMAGTVEAALNAVAG